MTRLTLACAAALTLACAPAFAQTKPTAQPPQSTQAAPGSDAWMRQHGETNANAPMSEQDPAELAATAKLNAGIVANNEAAEQAEAADQARFSAEQSRFETDNERWQADTARAATARAQWEADVAASNAAQAQYERDRAAYEAELAACRARGSRCVVTPN